MRGLVSSEQGKVEAPGGQRVPVRTHGVMRSIMRFAGGMRQAKAPDCILPVSGRGEGRDLHEGPVTPVTGAEESAPDGFRGGAAEREGGGPLAALRAATCEYPLEGHSGRP